jgi:hypothetical protein
MNLAQHVENLFAQATPAEMDELLRKSNFDHFNAVGVNIPSPEQALREAEKQRTFSSDLVVGPAADTRRSWTAEGSGYARQVSAGNNEEMPIAA